MKSRGVTTCKGILNHVYLSWQPLPCQSELGVNYEMAVLSSPLVLIQSIPPVTRAFTAATILSSALYAWLCWKGLASDASHYLTLVPGSSLFAPWTFFTSAFVETSIFEVRFTTQVLVCHSSFSSLSHPSSSFLQR